MLGTAAIGLALFGGACDSSSDTSSSPAGPVRPPAGSDSTFPAPHGEVHFLKIANSSFDRHTRRPTAADKDWMRRHYERMVTYSPYFDPRTSWYSAGWMYKDAYAIYRRSELARRHPDWILRDANGNALYIPYGCTAGVCPQYAGDFGNPSFRQHWLEEATRRLRLGYVGLFIDDVNMDWRVGNGSGDFVVPVDPRTGVSMRLVDWQRYMAEFMEYVRRHLPSVEIAHNVIWYADTTVGAQKQHVDRELDSADYVNLERGVNDSGLQGGTGRFGFGKFLAFVDYVHARGIDVVLQSTSDDSLAEAEYNLASYFAINLGQDLVSSATASSPDDWWPGYDVNLGAARGARYVWSGLLRRDFEQGLVLINPPDAQKISVSLPAPYVDLAGNRVSSIELEPASGVVLQSLD
jgi:hypothetical protein